MKVRLAVVAVLGLLVLLAGVLVVTRTGTRSATAEQVQDHPARYYGHVVRVSGTVVRVTPSIHGFRAFELRDETGTVWVVTRLDSPPDGERVDVEGRVNSGLTTDIPIVGTLNVGAYVVEEKRKARD